MEGLACEDQDAQRLCLGGKCSKSVCHDKQQGNYCDRKWAEERVHVPTESFRMEKVCVDDVCENPCARVAPHLVGGWGEDNHAPR